MTPTPTSTPENHETHTPASLLCQATEVRLPNGMSHNQRTLRDAALLGDEGRGGRVVGARRREVCDGVALDELFLLALPQQQVPRVVGPQVHRGPLPSQRAHR